MPNNPARRVEDLVPNLRALSFDDPRSAGQTIGIIAFYHHGHDEPCDTLCGAPFLANFFDLGEGQLLLTAPNSPTTVAFRNAESAYQALKFWPQADQFAPLSGQEALELKKRLSGKEDFSCGGYGSTWPSMLAVIRAKFAIPALQQALILTGDAFIIEHSSIEGDKVLSDNWNWLGMTLMIVRDELMDKSDWTLFLGKHIDLSTGKPNQEAGREEWQGLVQKAAAKALDVLSKDAPPPRVQFPDRVVAEGLAMPKMPVAVEEPSVLGKQSLPDRGSSDGLALSDSQGFGNRQSIAQEGIPALQTAPTSGMQVPKSEDKGHLLVENHNLIDLQSPVASHEGNIQAGGGHSSKTGANDDGRRPSKTRGSDDGHWPAKSSKTRGSDDVHRSPRPSKTRGDDDGHAPRRSSKTRGNDLHEELLRTRLERDEARQECDFNRARVRKLEMQLSNPTVDPLATGEQQQRTFVVAACEFKPHPEHLKRAGLVVPGDKKLLYVSAGQSLEIVRRHLTGWVRARRLPFPGAQGEELAEEGWVPDGVLQAVGEVGRGIASRTCAPSDEDNGEFDAMQLAVGKGTLLKLLGREGEWWLVEADGCRGFVPMDAVREPSPDEENGMTALGMRLRRGKSRLLEASPSSTDVTDMDATQLGEASEPRNRDRQKLVGDVEAPKEAKKPKDEEKMPWTLGLWAYLASYYAIALNILLGVAGIFYSFRGEHNYPEGLKGFSQHWRHFWCSIFSIGCGIGWLAFNWKSKFASSSGTLPAGTPLRGSIFLLMSIPLLSSGVTMLAGLATAFCGALSVGSALRKEQGAKPVVARQPLIKHLTDEMEEELKRIPRCSIRWLVRWWEIQETRGEQPKWVMIGLWLLANVLLMTRKYYVTRYMLMYPTPLVLEQISHCWDSSNFFYSDADCSILLDRYQTWLPLAKSFGEGLNLNCALVILPVCSHFIIKINTTAISGSGWLGRLCRKLPTHKNMIFHKSIAITIAVYSFGHTFAHYMAYSFTLAIFQRQGFSSAGITLSIWATGALILMTIIVMYPVSRDYVKRTMFEAFYYTHLFGASTFMLSLLWHGPVFHIWGAIPLCLYLVDMYTRHDKVSSNPAKLLQMRWRPPVLQLVFEAPWKYYSGQYVTLCCPKISPYETHPFTIASAAETGLLNLAIKCWPGGWTDALREFLGALVAEEDEEGGENMTLDPKKGFEYNFEKVDWLSGRTLRGMTTLKDDTPLMKIEGPHAAPAMRYREYEAVILAVAGIGLTPGSSILRSLLQYQWRKDANAMPHSVYFAWLVACAEVPAFEWFSDELSDIEVAAHANIGLHGAETLSKRALEMHLFVTRAPPPEDVHAEDKPEPTPAELHSKTGEKIVGEVPRPYTGPQLLKWMQHPKTSVKDASGVNKMESILKSKVEKRENQAGHTLLWNGRPDWKVFFDHVADAHRAPDGGTGCQVGVFFCGAPAIGKDLKRQCHKSSKKDIHFKIMKESF